MERIIQPKALLMSTACQAKFRGSAIVSGLIFFPFAMQLQFEMKIQKLWQESCLFFSPKKVHPKMVPFDRSNTNNIHFNLF